MLDGADPRNGWDMKAVLHKAIGPATNDVYGRLHHYLMDLFVKFQKQVATRTIAFELYQLDAVHLHTYLQDYKFDRIEVGRHHRDPFLAVHADQPPPDSSVPISQTACTSACARR
jgi:hypothetical protein